MREVARINIPNQKVRTALFEHELRNSTESGSLVYHVACPFVEVTQCQASTLFDRIQYRVDGCGCDANRKRVATSRLQQSIEEF